jgi:peptide-methionine (S)-S-oxide reductase
VIGALRRLRWLVAAAGLLAAPAARGQSPTPPAGQALAVATFAAGCFWCSEADFEKVPGVVDAVSGYTGGRVANPTYKQVSDGGTGHYEAVQVRYDPARVSYAQLLDVFWRNVDPFDAGGQFCDRGPQYRAAVFYQNETERRAVEASRQKLEQSPQLRRRRVLTEILPVSTFYPAEEYHQSYYKKNPIRYKFYRSNCGRDKRLRAVWG